MNKPSPLDELAAQAGIEPQYQDVWGARHALSIDTKRAFLEAMGISAATEELIAQSLAALRTKPWRRALESVTVLYEGRNEWTTSVVSEVEPVGHAAWSVTTEDGTKYVGNICLGDLPLAEANAVDGRRLERRLLALPGSLPLGYHRLEVTGDALPSGSDVATLIVAPQQAYLPEQAPTQSRNLGIRSSAYGLQGQQKLGPRRFRRPRRLRCRGSRPRPGALGLNPLHALFPGNPAHASPYSPSSRCFLNPLYINIERCPILSNARGQGFSSLTPAS